MFEKGLPGYDSWLDNHGNPGMGNVPEEDVWYWAVTAPIEITQRDENTYRIQHLAGPEWFDLSFDRNAKPGMTMLFNGKFHDVGDDFISYVSVIDQYHEDGGGIGITLRQEPFEDEESE